jgi:hypothetical protein
VAGHSSLQREKIKKGRGVLNDFLDDSNPKNVIFYTPALADCLVKVARLSTRWILVEHRLKEKFDLVPLK